MKKSVPLYLLMLLMVFLPYIYLLQVYQRLPALVPTHFGWNGKADTMSNKASLWGILSISAVVSVGIFFLLRFLPVIDPKKKAKLSSSEFTKIGVAVVVLLSLINCMIVNSAARGSFNFTHLLPLLFGIFFAFMGNIMHSIKPNYFAGIRTPWTLESEETWRKTHQFASKLWMAAGVLLIAISLFLPSSLTPLFMIGIVIVISVTPVIYSYRYFKTIQKRLV